MKKLDFAMAMIRTVGAAVSATCAVIATYHYIHH